MFQKDSIIPSSLYYLPLMKRMTELDGPIRVELMGDADEPVEVKAPDGETAKLEVMREEWAVFYTLADEEQENRIFTWQDLPATLEAQLTVALKEHLDEAGFSTVVKTTYKDGLVFRGVSLFGTPKGVHNKPELYLWLEAYIAEFSARDERAKVDAHRRKANEQMDKKRVEKRRAEEERRQREQEAAAKELARTPLDDLVEKAKDQDAFLAAWESLDQARKMHFDKDMNPDNLTPEQRTEVVSLAQVLDSQFGKTDPEEVAAAAVPGDALERSAQDWTLTHDPTGMPYSFDELDAESKAAWERLNGPHGAAEKKAASEEAGEGKPEAKRGRGRPRKDKTAESHKTV